MIRAFTSADYPGLAVLANASAFREYRLPAHALQIIDARASGDADRLVRVVAEDAGRLVGAASLLHLAARHERDHYVLSLHGSNTSLVPALYESVCRAAGRVAVTTTNVRADDPALAALRSLGFAETSTSTQHEIDLAAIPSETFRRAAEMSRAFTVHTLASLGASLDELFQLQLESDPGQTSRDAAAHRWQLTNPLVDPTRSFVIRIGDRPVSLMVVWHLELEPEVFWIRYVVTHPLVRGRAVFAGSLVHAISLAKERGFARLAFTATTPILAEMSARHGFTDFHTWTGMTFT